LVWQNDCSMIPTALFNGKPLNVEQASGIAIMPNILQWSEDERTAKAASGTYPFPKRDKPAEQFKCRFLTTQTWNDRVVQPATWKRGSLLASPTEIIQQFKSGRYTQALALAIVWGSMWRTCPYIYANRTAERIEQIEHALPCVSVQGSSWKQNPSTAAGKY
jgi:hypothetical protein